VEDARRVWIYRAVPDCLADGCGPRDAASRMGSGGHGNVFFWASVSLAEGAFERCNSLVLLALLYSWHAEDASELRPRSGTRGRSIKRIRGRSGGAATSLTV
jgi:hypothetical protein